MDSSRIHATTDMTNPRVDDLSSLAWVNEELRRSLEAAHKALRRFVKESEALSGSDVDAVDPSVLRTARQQIHQGVGALELVGLPEVAAVLRASEAAVQRFVAKPAKLTNAQVETIEQASFALLDYIQRVLTGKQISPLALFPQYQAVQTLAGADRIHPADLWAVDWRWRELPGQSGVAPHAADGDARQVLEQQLLALMRGPVAPAAARMSEMCASLGAGAASLPAATLWKLAAAFFESLAQGLLEPDVFSKRVASRLLAQLRSFERGDADVSERLAQDLLFFCAQSLPPDAARKAPRLAAVRDTYGLTATAPTDYNVSQLGRFDPALIAQARKRVASARDSWSAVAGGEMHRLGGLSEQFSLVGDSLKRLYPSGELLADELQHAIVATQQSGALPSPQLAMEVATSVLYLEASLEDVDFDHVDQAERVGRLAQRISLVRAGQTPPPLEPWMEELYRRVSDRQTMGSVVQELHASLSEVEKLIDQFFRNPTQRDVLLPVPNQLSAMRGVLSVLGLDQASQAVLRMRDDVDGLISTEVDPAGVVASGTFDRLAGNVGALGFLINMLSVQPQAKSLFVFDAESGRLNPVIGRAAAPQSESPAAPPSVEPRLLEQAQALAISVGSDEVPVAEVTRGLERLSQDAEMADQPALQAAVEQAQAAIEQAVDRGDADELSSVRGQLSDALADFVSTASDPVGLEALPAPVAAPAQPVPLSIAPAGTETDLGDDPEMREIFLEEAREVIDTGESASAHLAKVPGDVEQLTSLRRAFHTLKGSSRMVGLKEFGEAGWAAEQVFNSWLASQKPAEPPLLEFSSQTLAYLKSWVEAIADGRAAVYTAAPVKAAADALNAGATWPPIGLPTAAPSLPDFAEPLPATEVTEPTEAGRGDEVVETLDLSLPALSDDATAEPLVAEPANVDLPLATPAVAAAEAAPAADDALSFSLDLGALDDASTPAAAPELIEPAPEVSELELDFSAFTGDAPVAPPLAPPPGEAPELTLPEIATEPEPAATALTAVELTPADAESVDAAEPEFTLNLGDELPLPAASIEGVELLPLSPTAEPVAALEPAPMFPEPSVADLVEVAELPAAPDANDGVVDLVLDEPVSESVVEPVVEPTLTLPEDVVDLGAPEVEVAEPAVETPAAAAGFPEDDQVKVVGPLRIGIPLFNIYLNEADELSRRLTTEVAEWAMELHRPVGEMPIALAHSLAGSSATVGFTDLSQLARQVEHALMRQQALGSGTVSDGGLFVDAAEEIRRLLHQFAAGFLKSPAPELLQRLAEHEISSAQRLDALTHKAAEESAVDAALHAEPETGDAVGLTAEALPAIEDLPDAHEPAAAASAPLPLTADSGFAPLGRAELKTLAPLQPLQVSEARPAAVRDDLLDDEDDIDAVDAVDAELFPIFEEEAQELLPALSSALRDWARRPADRNAAASCMRTLHTLKGGARLAGAMRLGEMAHRLESAIEHLLAQESPHAGDVEALQARSDALTLAFETLRSRDAQAYAEAEAAVTQQMATMPEVGESAFTPLAPTAPASAVLQEPLAPVAAVDAARDELGRVTPEAAPETAVEPIGEASLAAEVDSAQTAAETPAPLPEVAAEIDWSRFVQAEPGTDVAVKPATNERAGVQTHASVRVRGPLLERMVNQAGEVSITRSRIEAEVGNIRSSLNDLTDNLERLRGQLRDIEFQAELQMSSRLEAAKAAHQTFDPLESDRFTRFQELTRMMAESVNDVATVQRTLQRTLETTEDELVAQGRLTRDLQDDLLRTRMVEFEGQSDRLYRVVRQAAKETGKHVRLDIVGGSIEIDRGVLDRMMPAFEHLLRNCVTHGIESPEARAAAGKDGTGNIVVSVQHEGNEVAVEFRDDGAGLNLDRIRQKGVAMGLIGPNDQPTDAELANLIFTPGFSTAEVVTELAGRGVGMDVVRAEVNAMGGRIETATARGQGTSFKLVLPLTTAVTQVVMLRCGNNVVAVPSTLIEIVRRATGDELERAYASGAYALGDRSLPFFWLGSLLQLPPSNQEAGRMRSIVVVRSAQQRVALHVDEVLGNQEVVVKNLGPQLARLPGLARMTLLASGAVALIYNPVALATLYGDSARAAMEAARHAAQTQQPVIAEQEEPAARLAPLVLVVDDSLTVRRVTQRLLVREGYRVQLAKDGMEALERLAEVRPAVVLSDIEMPRMDGFDLVRNIRGDARLRDLPVIMITSRIAQKHRDYAAELGVDHYLGKPYSEEDLLALIARYTAQEVAA